MIEAANFALTELCLVTAVDVEFNAATSLLRSKNFSNEFQIKTCRGTTAQRRVTVLQCGMGASGFVPKLSEHLQHHRYDALIVAGLAGGLHSILKSGDAVIYDRCDDARQPTGLGLIEKPSAREENASIPCHSGASEFLAAALGLSDQRYFRGAGITTSRIITEARDKSLLGTEFQALAVDMESYDVLDVCANLGLPASVMRIISDEVGSDLPDFNRAAEADGQLNPWRTAVAMAARPAASWTFVWNIKSVIATLRNTLNIVLNA